MRMTRFAGIIFVIVAVEGGFVALAADAPVPAAPAAPAAPNTLWSFLGIPQACNKIKDAHINKKGDKPCKERVPPLKRIADPANMESQNPAIKEAAKVKADEDLAPQKIKAIKYLATVGCGCYPGVREALLAALDDCTEEVRYQAAVAFSQAAGNPCDHCNRSGCCNAAVMTKLEEMAHGQDEKGCFKEPSPRVRQAADNALHACRQVIPPSPTPAAPETEPKKELPIQPAPESLPNPPEKPAATTGTTSAVIVQPISMAGFAEADDKDPEQTTEAVAVALRPFGRRCPPGYETVICPRPPEEGKAAPGAAAPEGAAEQAAPPTNALAGNYGAAAGPMSAAPNMIGDFCSSGGNVIFRGFNAQEQFAVLSQGNVAISGGDRTFKIAENDNPIPTNRVFFDYNHYQNPVIDAQGNVRNLDRFTFGVEKTFFHDQCSVEVRIPFDNGLNSTQSLAPDAGLMGTEFGDIPIVFKAILRKWDNAILAAGFAVTLPTAKDASLFDQSGTEQILVRNDAVHVGPVVGLLWTPSDRWFVEGFVQADFDTRGNDVYVNTGASTNAGALTKAGTVQDPSLLFMDLAVGRWIYKNPCGAGLRAWLPSSNCTMRPPCRMLTASAELRLARTACPRKPWDAWTTARTFWTSPPAFTS